ncbi:sugar ABC transporter permease [Actinoplanes sp. TBRC 11911]|uniref:carbohydrate ABC transporter permease n=1 Tax=Actinoplanes sp. TBRC 11911 TaxID=2729386 RepID=UPI00145E49BF|nr:sugar ABC transporter permease [Actinoplanes sp. TBRC 11911]NMO56834.1 sugar ABC transporter permease [Actinoplanes sp. TBRC 11911]
MTGKTRRRRAVVPLWFLLPGIVIYGAVVLLPSVIGSGYALTDATTGDAGTFIGLANFRTIFSSTDTVGPLIQTLVMAAAVMVLQNVLGLLLAVALNSRIRSRNWLRVLFFAPFVVSPLVSGYLWKYLLDPDGAVNQALSAIGLGSLRQPWLGEPRLALFSLIVAVVWQFTGSTMVIYLAGLQGVPQDVVEAASIDGAGAVRRFFSVVRPFLAPAFMVNLTLSLIAGLRLYDQIVAMTNGGPGGSTDSLSTVIYRTSFEFGEFGLGSAMAVVLTVLVILLSLVQYLGLRKQARA